VKSTEEQNSYTAGNGTGTAHAGNGSAEAEAELARYLPHLSRMSVQLRQTAAQIEDSVVEVCKSFQGIAERSRATVARTSDFLVHDSDTATGKRSFESLLQACGQTMLGIMASITEAGQLSRRAIERIEQIDRAAQQISLALMQLEHISTGNKILALNARIEAARSGSMGAGFAAVAVELASQTVKSRDVTAEVGELAANLRALAEFTLEDLRAMSSKDQERVQQCKREVDDAIRELHAAHDEMKSMMNSMTADGTLLASDIGNAVRGLQFQDRTNQRIAHVVEDLETLQQRLRHGGNVASSSPAADEGFSAYTMREEREVAGLSGEEAPAGDVELF
jgi:methyl-accepting chemotaxis protein